MLSSGFTESVESSRSTATMLPSTCYSASVRSMAVESSMTPLGSVLPDQTLSDLDDVKHNLLDLRGTGVLVVVFAANHCPYVRHIEAALGDMAREFSATAASFVAICSNDTVSHPDDDIAGLKEQKSRAGWDFPYLVDSDQNVARLFGAVCTPDFFVYDIENRLAYRGAFDASSPKNGEPLTGDDLRTAISLVLEDHPVPEPQRPSMGCGIKWR